MDFDLDALTPFVVPPDATRRLHLEELGGAVLVGRCANQENEGYWNAYLLAQAELAQKQRILADRPQLIEQEQRKAEIRLLAEHVITGWERVTAGGQPAPFSAAACEELLTKVAAKAPRVWVKIDGFFSSHANFTNRALAAAEALGGNSSSG